MCFSKLITDFRFFPNMLLQKDFISIVYTVES